MPEVTTCCQILDAFLRSPSLWMVHCLINHLLLEDLLVCLLKSHLFKEQAKFSDLVLYVSLSTETFLNLNIFQVQCCKMLEESQ